mmetsp:Transcript_11007/g.25152  ORF Transcript_11007/g.25152 Transcript_11007/m.25152 type:complete len:298 (+) Transcript_11007:190-1083(+)
MQSILPLRHISYAHHCLLLRRPPGGVAVTGLRSLSYLPRVSLAGYWYALLSHALWRRKDTFVLVSSWQDNDFTVCIANGHLLLDAFVVIPHHVLLCLGLSEEDRSETALTGASKRYVWQGLSDSRLLTNGDPALSLHQLSVALHVELALNALARHWADLAKDRSIREGPIMQAKTPSNAHVTILVSPVQREAIIEPNGLLESHLWVMRPEQKLLRPIHSQVIVHMACCNQFPLRSIPPWVICLTPCQLQLCVRGMSRINPVLLQRGSRPGWQAFQRVVVVVEVAEVSSQFPPDDQLL